MKRKEKYLKTLCARRGLYDGKGNIRKDQKIGKEIKVEKFNEKGNLVGTFNNENERIEQLWADRTNDIAEP